MVNRTSPTVAATLTVLLVAAATACGGTIGDQAQRAPVGLLIDAPRGADVYWRVRDDDIGATMKGADEVAFKCGEVRGPECVTWWAWARYGTYTVQLTYRHDAADAGALTDAKLAVLVSNAGQDVADRAHRAGR
jgi:hypothetical protein